MKLASLVNINPLKESDKQYSKEQQAIAAKWESLITNRNLEKSDPKQFNANIEAKKELLTKLRDDGKFKSTKITDDKIENWAISPSLPGAKIADFMKADLNESNSINPMYNNPEGWRDYDPTQVMSFIYWTKQQLPPAEGTPEWEANWEKVQSFLNSKFPVDEGSCGYGPDGVPGDTPGETQGMDADRRTSGMIRKFIQKEISKLSEFSMDNHPGSQNIDPEYRQDKKVNYDSLEFEGDYHDLMPQEYIPTRGEWDDGTEMTPEELETWSYNNPSEVDWVVRKNYSGE